MILIKKLKRFKYIFDTLKNKLFLFYHPKSRSLKLLDKVCGEGAGRSILEEGEREREGEKGEPEKRYLDFLNILNNKKSDIKFTNLPIY